MSRIYGLEALMLVLFRVARLFHLDRLIYLGSPQLLCDYFIGLEKFDAVKMLFGDETETVIHRLKVQFAWIGGYMWIDSRKRRIVISSRYLCNSNRVDIYLDLIHELVHVKQLLEGRELFDNRYRYVERPTEVEAYRHTVKEARKLGLGELRICEYLKTEWMSIADLEKLKRALGVRC